MPNCFKCGALYGRGDDFCPKCGERLVVNKLKPFILIVIIIIGIGLFFVLKISKISSTTSSELPTAMATANPTSEDKNSDYYKEELQGQAEEDSLSRENLEDTQTIILPSKLPQEKKKCEWGYTDEYKCDGKVIQRKWMNSDCSFEWFYYLTCYYGCENGKCVDSPKCVNGYADEYKCEGDVLRRKWVYSDCSFDWSYYETCDYGCENSKCNDRPCGEWGYADEYKCDGKVIRRKWINHDCSFEWFYHETCDYGCENGECVDKPVEEQEECKWGYSGEYKCEGNVIKRKWVNSDCSFEWFYYLTCYYGCENGECVDKPLKEEANYIQDQCVYITNFHFNAAGDDNYNLNDEYVTFKNKCSYSIDMTSWMVRDETVYHVYTFPSFTFGSEATFTLYTGMGTNTNSALYWGRTAGDYAAIWNNQEGDTLFLKDSSGNLVLSQSYVGY